MMEILTNTALVCGFVFLMVAGVMHYFPPREINSLYGYRTAGSMCSHAHWQFAQRYSTRRMFEAALVLMSVGIALEFINLEMKTKIAIGLLALLAVPIYLFVRTERALKQKFPQ